MPKLIYKCIYCNKSFDVRSECEEHEEQCSSNPENSKALIWKAKASKIFVVNASDLVEKKSWKVDQI